MNRLAIFLLATILNACAPGYSGNEVAGSVSSCEIDNHIWEDDNGAPQHWNHFPLTVELDKSTLTGNQMASAMGAMDTWSDLAGVLVFTYEKVESIEGSQADVVVSNKELGGTLAGQTNNHYDPATGIIGNAHVWLDSNFPQDFWYPVSVHEFGHVLALGHDDNDPGSVMYPESSSGWQWDVRPNDVNFVRWETMSAQ